MPDPPLESDFVHRFKNKLSIAVGFSRLLVDESAADDPRRPDLVQIHEALQELAKMLAEQAGGRK